MKGLDETKLRIGDTLRIRPRRANKVGTDSKTHKNEDQDGVLLQVTLPRTPCRTFCFHMGYTKETWEGFREDFLRSKRTGIYLRVLQEGPPLISHGSCFMSNVIALYGVLSSIPSTHTYSYLSGLRMISLQSLILL